MFTYISATRIFRGAQQNISKRIMINEPQEPKHNFHLVCFSFVCSIKWDDLFVESDSKKRRFLGRDAVILLRPVHSVASLLLL